MHTGLKNFSFKLKIRTRKGEEWGGVFSFFLRTLILRLHVSEILHTYLNCFSTAFAFPLLHRSFQPPDKTFEF